MLRGKSNEVRVLEGIEGNGKTAYPDEAWVQSEVLYEPPLLKVTLPATAFCTIDARFHAALDPDGVYDILTDPNNRRVFKNIKEVTYRKVLEDDGNRQVIEVEHVGRWKFLVFSGSFASRLMVEQKREEHVVVFDLAKKGFMRKFTGSWKVEPMRASDEAAAVIGDGGNESNTPPGPDDPVVGSWVNFQQVLEPTMKPPWPLSNYIRGVAEKVVRDMLADLQRECQRLSELRKTSTAGEVENQKVVDNDPKVPCE